MNARTKKDAFPLPRIDDSLNSLSGQAWFSTLDLASGYWQVRLSEDAKPKTAFATHSGLFQFAVMPFGLCNAPATFERLMSQVMRGLHWKRCLVYIDDILVFGNDFESALHSLELVFIRVAEYGLQLKSTKCNLFRTSVPFLGHIVGRAGLECDPNKLSAVANWIPPNTIKETLARTLSRPCARFSSKLQFSRSPRKTCHISLIQTPVTTELEVSYPSALRERNTS